VLGTVTGKEFGCRTEERGKRSFKGGKRIGKTLNLRDTKSSRAAGIVVKKKMRRLK